jgi:TRAP-type mannitol/chloroaromatic compound transport system substrate-binding protein
MELRHISIGLIIGLIAGMIAGATVVRPHINVGPPPPDAAPLKVAPEEPILTDASPLPEEDPPVTEQVVVPPAPEITRWRMTSAYSGDLPVLGELPTSTVSSISRISEGRFELEFHEPGTLIPPEDMFEAVRSGTIHAAFSSPALWANKVPTLQLFSSVPFGPEAREILAWFQEGGGREIYEEIYTKQGLHSLLCGVTTPAASGWFKKPITKPGDLKGLRMRITGLGAKVMEKLGVTTEILMNNDIVVAMKSGALDAAVFSQPATDLALGLHRVANYVYFPGWLQPSALFDLMINQEAWNALTETEKAQIETVCGDNIRQGLVSADARQFKALKLFTEMDVQMKVWPNALLLAFRKAWKQVALEQSKRDKKFRQTLSSLQQFHDEFGIWLELSSP